jgi:hypothetical protein
MVHTVSFQCISFIYVLVPKWKQTLFGNGDSPYGNIRVSLPISEWGSPYGNGDPHMKYSHMVIFWWVPKWKQTLFGNRLVTEPSPFGNGDPFRYGDPHIEMGIRSIWFPIWKWGLTKRPHFHMGMCLSPFPYGNHHMEMVQLYPKLVFWYGIGWYFLGM